MMMNGLDLANFAITVSGLTISVLGLLLAVFLRRIDFERRGFFLVFLAYSTTNTDRRTVRSAQQNIL